eukprot:CAMPEP_0197851918 /NCGR_PEP_ID=MMETSP1438-20131217/19248_1 /TAXON_ID=1461541 /ORGANISM="Pterosperma sp., Strain CCMP1384" /LENGTH=106 /DNA_ID=CAMNT_0043465721 /DNA_START=322 /DNA_END=639 /DNA_ORIENTATION=+
MPAPYVSTPRGRSSRVQGADQGVHNQRGSTYLQRGSMGGASSGVLDDMQEPLYLLIKKAVTDGPRDHPHFLENVIHLWAAYVAPWIHTKPLPDPLPRQQAAEAQTK